MNFSLNQAVMHYKEFLLNVHKLQAQSIILFRIYFSLKQHLTQITIVGLGLQIFVFRTYI
jgi:hypothetical protein